MDITVKREVYVAVTKDYGQRFYIEAFFGTIRSECMAELVKVMIIYFGRLEYFLVAVLNSTWFNDFIRTRQNGKISFVSELFKVFHKKIGYSNTSE